MGVVVAADAAGYKDLDREVVNNYTRSGGRSDSLNLLEADWVAAANGFFTEHLASEAGGDALVPI